jgi:tricorn protease
MRKNAVVRIDFDGIESCILSFPVEDGRYQQIAGIRGKVLFTSLPIEGSLHGDNWPPSAEPQGKATLEVFDFESQKAEELVAKMSYFVLSADRKTLVYRAARRLRVLKAGEKPDEKLAKEPAGKKSGWIDLARVKVSVKPPAEWRQMYREAWRLQRDQFWTADMSKVNWQAVYDRYLPLVDRIATRAEFSDLMWEMRELGVARYEFGDHRQPRRPRAARRGFCFMCGGQGVEKSTLWGDPWDEEAAPLVARVICVKATHCWRWRISSHTATHQMPVGESI